MEVQNQKALNPKNKRAALNQAVQCQLFIDRNQERKENVMKHYSDVQAKIEKLEEELKRLEANIEKLDIDSESYQGRLSLLQTQFELTELEISEAKLESLKRNIAKQQALIQAGLRPEDSTFLD